MKSAQGRRSGERRASARRGSRVAGWALAAHVALCGAAYGQALPPGATPGGALPKVPLPPVRIDEAPLFAVPPVIDRPLAVDEGARLFVSGFRVEGLAVEPIERIRRDEIEALVESLRIERQGLDRIGPNGFVEEELAEITDFMRNVVDQRDLDMHFDRYQALVDRLRVNNIERRAGMTIGQLQEIANAVTDYYRKRGFILAQAFVPAQDIVDGVVTIEVLESKLGRVMADGNERFSSELLARPFEELIDAPVVASRIESAILTVSDYPGLSAFAVFQPGKVVGTSDIVLRVQDEKPITGSLRVDNEGTRFTGENRVVADVTWNNPSGAADRLSGSFVNQFNPKNGLLFGVEYVRPIFYPGMSVGASFDRNIFEVGAEFEGDGITGESDTAEVFLRHALERGRRFNLYGDLAVRRTSSQSRVNGTVVTQDNLSMVDGGFRFDHIDTDTRAINQGGIAATVGLGGVLGGMTNRDPAQNTPPSRRDDENQPATSHFFKAAMNFSRLQILSENQSIVVRTEAQYSPSLLSSTEQYQIGGPSNFRAFPVSELQVDSAVFGSLEWTFKAPFFADKPAFNELTWGEIFRVSFFSDFVWGDLNLPTDNDLRLNAENFFVGGAGMGIQFNVPGVMSARFQAALPIGGRDIGRDPDDTDAVRRNSVQYWFDLNYTF